MAHLSQEAKQAIIEKILSDKRRTLREWSKIHNVGISTLHKWLKTNRTHNQNNNSQSKVTLGHLTQSERFKHLMATSGLDDVAIGTYCRKHGLYSHQLQQWKEEFMAQNNEQKSSQQSSELKALRAENKLLKQDLRRKEKALAETTALLVLKKKADLIWGEPEDD